MAISDKKLHVQYPADSASLKGLFSADVDIAYDGSIHADLGEFNRVMEYSVGKFTMDDIVVYMGYGYGEDAELVYAGKRGAEVLTAERAEFFYNAIQKEWYIRRRREEQARFRNMAATHHATRDRGIGA